MMERRRRNYFIGVRGKLVLSLLLLVVLSMWLLGLALMGLTRSALESQLSARAKVIAAAVENIVEISTFPSSGEIPVAGETARRLERLLKSMRGDPDIEQVTVFDRTGSPVAGGDRRGRDGSNRLLFTFPLTLGPGQTGSIDVLFAHDSTQRQLAFSLVRIIVQLFITALVIVVFINILASLTVLAPIRRLLIATERIGGGDLTHPVDAAGRDEIGDLGRAFNDMLGRLRGSEAKIREQLESLRQTHGELQAKEDQLVESEKMAAVGRVAAGVAHEVGNPLGSVTGYLAMLRDEKLSEEEFRDCLQRTGQELERVNRIMHDLLNYARPQRLEWCDMDVTSLVRDTLTLVASQQEFAAATFRTKLAEGLPVVRGDLHLAQQMLVNILLNASQAMPDGGCITLRTFADASGGAGISVEDEGPGIRDEDLSHIFEPFFTLKKQGRGSGLGLALCKRIAASMNVSLEVDSRPGDGATFRLTFPTRGGEEREPEENG
jgi:two-component system NtrC family sensor kinase